MDIPIKVGATVNNQVITDTFKCAPQGGMRRAHKTNSLVLVADHVKSVYDDVQQGDIFLYTGMGMSGDQSLEFAQNKTLYESGSNGINLFFFEVFKSGEYVYRGRVMLAEEPYKSSQVGEDGSLRMVWIFPLKLLENYLGEIPKDVIEDYEASQLKRTRKLDLAQLKLKADIAGSESSSRLVKTKTYIRNQYISEFTRRSANGTCQLCKEEAPFKDKSGNPYLESHHIEWLSKGGPDIIENTVALCPNCHKRMHVLNDPYDIAALKQLKSS